MHAPNLGACICPLTASTESASAGGSDSEETGYLYTYETRVVKVGGNETFAGGTGGTSFWFHDSGAALKELKAWTADNWGGHGYGVQAIKAVLSNGKELVVGDVPKRPTKSLIKFSPGERIKGAIHMSGSGARAPPCALDNPDCTKN